MKLAVAADDIERAACHGGLGRRTAGDFSGVGQAAIRRVEGPQKAVGGDDHDAASGEDFDEKWLALMVRHLENGVTMAEDVLQTGIHAGTKALATEIVASQKKQLASVKTQP